MLLWKEEFMIDNKNFTNNNVKYLREKNNISQSKMSKDLNIDQSTLAKWENGTRQITLDWAIKIANYFDISVGDFISNDYIHNTCGKFPSSDEEYKQILLRKGAINENDDITEEDAKKLIDFAIANRDYLIKKEDKKG